MERLQVIAFSNFYFFMRGNGRGATVSEIMKEPKRDHEEETDYEYVCRRGEERARLADTTQISNRNEGDEDEAKYDFVLVQPGITCSLRCRRNRRDTRGNRHRYRQNIIDEQRR